jgi:hypothetical protein
MILAVVIFLLCGPSAMAGRHSQSTHSTPKGYHHDGTICFTDHPETLIFVLILIILMVIVMIARSGEELGSQRWKHAEARQRRIWDQSLLEERRRKAAELRRQRAERRAQERTRRLAERNEYYLERGVKPGPWAWYQVMPEWEQAILYGFFLFAIPIGGLVFELFRVFR